MTTHPDIVEFMTLYEKIQGATKGQPNRIPFLYKNDCDFADICRRIDWLHFILNFKVSDSGDTVLENVDPRFISKWRHYERELDSYIGNLRATELLGQLGLRVPEGEPSALSDSDLEDEVQNEVRNEVADIELRLEMGSFERLGNHIDEEISDRVYNGEKALERLFGSLNVDFFDLLYRQKQLSVVHES